MSRSRTWVGPSESQANAEALARRSMPYTDASGATFRVQWDFHRREPRDLRDAVRQVRRAYADEVPHRLHEGPDSIGDDGTPKMTAKAEGYLFGAPGADDAGRTTNDDGSTTPDLVGYYHSPFRAALARWEQGDESERRRAAIVRHVTIGGRGPVEAAMEEGIPLWSAKHVAEWALRSFLRGLTDIRVHAPPLREAGAVA